MSGEENFKDSNRPFQEPYLSDKSTTETQIVPETEETVPEDETAPELKVPGQCIGLSKQIFGEECPFVESDMQFARYAAEAIISESYKLQKDQNFLELKPSLSIDIYSEFFVDPQVTPEGNQPLIASMLQVKYNSELMAL